MGIIIVASILLVGVIYLLIKKIGELSREKELKKYVAWCVSNNSTIYRCSLDLWHYVYNAQNDITEEYRISSDEEWETVKEILRGFCQELTQDYFYGRLNLPKTKYTLWEHEYFMLSLVPYLDAHQCDSVFLGHEMHEKRLSYKAYGQWGGQLYDAEYSLTDFAITMNKLYYIAYMYCKKNSTINPTGDLYRSAAGLEKIISGKTMKISRT